MVPATCIEPRLLWTPGLVTGTMAAAGALEDSRISNCHSQTAPSQPREASPTSGEIWMLKVTGGIKTQWETHSRWYYLAGAVVRAISTTREIGEPGDIWRWEKIGR